MANFAAIHNLKLAMMLSTSSGKQLPLGGHLFHGPCVFPPKANTQNKTKKKNANTVAFVGSVERVRDSEVCERGRDTDVSILWRTLNI